jgi:hypothetical protein
MAMIDPESERQRLADFYSLQMDGELEKTASEAADLTPLAREILQHELARRGLTVQLRPEAPEIPQRTEESPAVPDVIGLRGDLPYDAAQAEDFVVIRRFRDLPEALLAKGSLDSSGIESILVDDNTIRMDWFWSNLLGGIKLLVVRKDAEAATEVLDGPISAALELEDEQFYRQPRCPNCQSLDVSFQELYKPIAFGSLLLNFPLPVHRRGWRCQSCRHEWQEESSGQSETPS